MAFIIIDLEFNNLSGIHKCIPNVYTDNPNLKNLELDNEIIEIGAVKLDSHMQPCEELKVYIKPSVIPIINPKILDITKINIKDLENGVGFIKGLNKLKDMVQEGDIICSWAKDEGVTKLRLRRKMPTGVPSCWAPIPACRISTGRNIWWTAPATS